MSSPRPLLTPGEAIAITAPHARRTGFFFDFDGTLAPIREDPDAAEPAPGVVPALARLAQAVRRVVIVSARPVRFLRERLQGAAPLTYYGLYGLETQREGNALETDPGALPWVPVIEELTDRARRELPAGVRVEHKRLSVALHYRGAPGHATDVERWAGAEAGRLGLAAQRGRMVVELKPPVERDKGDVVRGETGDLERAWYFGDDLSDLAAYRALREREAVGDGFVGIRVAMANPESGAALAAEADFELGSPAELPDLLAVVTRALG